MELIDKFKIIRPSDFPEWVSLEALAVLEWTASCLKINEDGEVACDLYPEPRQCLEAQEQYAQYLKCFKSPEMEYCWLKAKSLNVSHYSDGQFWLAQALSNSFPYVASRFLPKQAAEKWKSDLLGLLKKAKEQVDTTPQNMSPWFSHTNDLLRSKISNKLLNQQCNYEVENMSIPTSDEILDCMIQGLEKVEYDLIFSGKHVNSRTSNRNYFMNSLTCALYQDVGQPFRKLVTNATNAAFECSISEREVVRATEQLHWEKMPLVVTDRLGVFEKVLFLYLI